MLKKDTVHGDAAMRRCGDAARFEEQTMAMTIMLTALAIGGTGAGTALLLGASWWAVLLAFVGAGNLACFAAVGLAFLRASSSGPDRKQPQLVRRATQFGFTG